MRKIVGLVVLGMLTLALDGRRKAPVAEQPPEEQTKAIVPTICVYTLGDVRASLLNAMMDSLRAHYPKCEVAGNIALPEEAKTTKRHDHVRHRADVLNKVLRRYKTDTTRYCSQKCV